MYPIVPKISAQLGPNTCASRGLKFPIFSTLEALTGFSGIWEITTLAPRGRMSEAWRKITGLTLAPEFGKPKTLARGKGQRWRATLERVHSGDAGEKASNPRKTPGVFSCPESCPIASPPPCFKLSQPKAPDFVDNCLKSNRRHRGRPSCSGLTFQIPSTIGVDNSTNSGSVGANE